MEWVQLTWVWVNEKITQFSRISLFSFLDEKEYPGDKFLRKNIHYIKYSSGVTFGNNTCVHIFDSQVNLLEGAIAIGYEGADIKAYDQSYVILRKGSKCEAFSGSIVVALEESSVIQHRGSTVISRGGEVEYAEEDFIDIGQVRPYYQHD